MQCTADDLQSTKGQLITTWKNRDFKEKRKKNIKREMGFVVQQGTASLWNCKCCAHCDAHWMNEWMSDSSCFLAHFGWLTGWLDWTHTRTKCETSSATQPKACAGVYSADVTKQGKEMEKKCKSWSPIGVRLTKCAQLHQLQKKRKRKMR